MRLILAGLLLTAGMLLAQTDSVDVTFYYFPDNNPGSVHIPGEFNGWNPSSSASAMSYDGELEAWFRAIRLRVGGPSPLPSSNSIPGAYQYKFHDGNWFPDPLNPQQNPNDNNNSYLYIHNPTIHQIFPNSTPAYGLVRTRNPEITALLFPAIGDEIDTASVMVRVDGISYTQIGASYDPGDHTLRFVLPDALSDGEHDLYVSAASVSGSSHADSTTFSVQADFLQFYTRPAETWKASWRIQAAVFNAEGELDLSVTQAQVIQADETIDVSVIDGLIDTTLEILEGDNVFQIMATLDGSEEQSSELIIHRIVEHAPTASINVVDIGSQLILTATSSQDPDGGELSYLWSEDMENPESLGLNGATDGQVFINIPTAAGEYFVNLVVEDPTGEIDSTRQFFFVHGDGSVDVGSFADNPQWVKNSSIYLLFFKAFTPGGTIADAIPNLDYIQAMGFNTIWVLPVMEIPGDVDNQINIGYYISDLMNVESSLGSNQDYKDFVAAAHELGIRVIQDVTPNHIGRVHPFAQEALLYGEYSPYWDYMQTDYIPHNNNGLGDCETAEGIRYYCAFSDVLLNYDWRDLDAQTYMIEVYKHWVREYDIDGYRFDVYWGPSRKFGEENMGVPVREALKQVKPDILLLGEDGGTGAGTEAIYADQGGGLDVAYDANLYWNSIHSFGFSASAVNGLHSSLDNAGYYPGENSYYLRFLENQDEDRITYRYNSFQKTMPMASAIFMAPGIPLMLNGQEVGWGLGMGAPGEPDLNDRRRGIIDWEFGGRELLTPHYQRLTQIRAQFPAFRQHRQDTNGDGSVTSADDSDFLRVESGNGIVYAFARPYIDSNGFSVVNFSASAQTVTLNVAENTLFSQPFHLDSLYWVNNHYAETSVQMTGAELAALEVNLEAWGTAIFTISGGSELVIIPPLPALADVEEQGSVIPETARLYPNFPNPFNPTTTLRYSLPATSELTLTVFDVRGRLVATLVEGVQSVGEYEIRWDGRDLRGAMVPTGLYFARLNTAQTSQVIKMTFLK